MSLRYVLLGLLSEKSGHGYGLRKLMIHRLGHFRNINEGQLYTELARMEKEGLTEREVQVPEKGPARKLIHITPAGRESFSDWLRGDPYEDRGVLYDFMQGFPFLAKFSFFNLLESHEVVAKIDRQITLLQEKEQAYRKILPQMHDRGVDRFRTAILAYGIEEVEHRIRWLQRMREACSSSRETEQ